MARGFLAGAIWGLVVSGIGAGALSVAMGPPANLPAAPEPRIATDPVAEAVNSLSERATPVPGAVPPEGSGEAAVPAVPPGETPEATPSEATPSETTPPETTATEAAPEETPEASETAAVSGTPETPPPPPARRPSEEQGVDTAAAGPALSAPPLAEGSAPDTQPSRRPEAIPAPLAPDAPGTSEAARFAVGGDAPVQPGLPALPPEAPLVEARPALSTDPAQPPQPAEDSGLASEPDPQPGPEAAEAGTEAPVSEDPEMSEETPQPVPAPQEPPAPRVTALVPDRPAAAPEAERPAIGTPATSLIDRAPEQDEAPEGDSPAAAPRIGTAPESGLPSISPAPAPPPPAAARGETPLQRFAASYDLAPGAPAMSILLIDDGAGPLGPETVEAFPFPVSFAIAPGHPDPAGAAAAYRARGFEVLAEAALPENATPADAEVALEGALASVPEAIAVLEGADLALQHNRAISEQAAGFLAASGHGLVMMPNGLNTAEALARRAGVPSLTVFRDFDGNGQDPRVMRRFLDQAAFRARQDENVVMLGRLRADTVSALLLWGLQDRASSVELVPVSALLLRQAGGN
ncbi:divergent polysaccharide deacetylase family protein [Salipiger sp. H15]|uniref:Divergent polysaccharide deacetylase family protein n=1 Tax=Alloyangia sp. H15 TaxID=3029062 RepID=A0AAU8AG88_9RHOB